MSFLGDLMNGGQQPAPSSPAPYIPTPTPNATILTEGVQDKTKHPNPGAIQSLGIRG